MTATRTVQHIAPFSIDEFGLLNQSPPYLQIGIIQGSSVSAFTIDAGSFFTFINGAGTIEQVEYPCFLQYFVDYLALNGFGTWTYNYDFATQTLTLDGGVNVAAFAFDASSELVLGMDSSLIQKSLYTSVRRPYYVWKSTEFDWQIESYPYEASKVATETETDDGRVYQLSNEDDLTWLSNKPLNITFLDWEHQWEPQDNVYIAHSTSIPYVWQQHIQTVRSYKPFLVYRNCLTSSTSYSDRMGTYKIRSEASKFKPVVSNKNLDSFWNVNCDTRQLSLGTNFGTYNPATANGLFDPTSIPNLLLWLNSDVACTFDPIDGFNWKDQSGNGYIFENTDPVSAPKIIQNSQMNGHPIVTCSNTELVLSTSPIDFESANAATLFVAFNFETQVLSGSAYFAMAGSTDRIQMFGFDSEVFLTYNSGSQPNTTWFDNTVLNLVDPYVASYVYQTYNSGSYFNSYSGASQINGEPTTGFYTTASSAAGLIASQTCLFGLNLRVCEYLIYNRELLQSEIAQVNGYLTEKYGV